ncbi:hypothetical protein TSAR_007825 [Trichomalopsis sarcophagae]|uniref:Uncharacterized protein n=1 Tax=Trichomalopsis sarcophagae TaxID=543379 RepID=A0A232FKK3_9HYME|nr:hypothetical protein TSAR_007825 [Trichomalopsis sarcophagae]
MISNAQKQKDSRELEAKSQRDAIFHIERFRMAQKFHPEWHFHDSKFQSAEDKSAQIERKTLDLLEKPLFSSKTQSAVNAQISTAKSE